MANKKCIRRSIRSTDRCKFIDNNTWLTTFMLYALWLLLSNAYRMFQFYSDFVSSPFSLAFKACLAMYSEGVTPKYFLNAAEKWFGFTIPTAYVT